jgi:hypothetical protein
VRITDVSAAIKQLSKEIITAFWKSAGRRNRSCSAEINGDERGEGDMPNKEMRYS